MSYDYERYDGKRIVVDGEVIGLLAMEFGHEVEEVWEEYHAELAMTEEQERQSEAYKESLRRTLSAQYEKVATLEADNAELRELVRSLHMAYVGALNECEGMDVGLIWEHCEMVDAELAKSHARFEADRHRFDVAMRELGVDE